MKSWKTSLGGAVTFIGVAFGQIYPEYSKVGALLAAVGTAFGLIFARDQNVTSQDAGAVSKITPTKTEEKTTP